MVRYKVFELKSFLNSFIIYGHYENHFYIFNHTHVRVDAENFSITKILWLLLLLGSENKLLISKKLKILIKKKSKTKILDPQKLQITMIMKGCRKDFNPKIWPNSQTSDFWQSQELFSTYLCVDIFHVSIFVLHI